MPPDDLSTWFVLTLSAEQAVREGDLEHLAVLMNRREELISRWTECRYEFSAKDEARVREYEGRLARAMNESQSELRAQIERLNHRKRAVESYRVG